ncbi:MAG: hypothetical protein UZ17_ACD001001343 [Acidobacteria bacterium OLB17]|nr:MAG: hypothetical protein UZ17_ACD001001343 [Acidobacteria bacterium OLB17]MCZ2391736.1 hypothetical protein [Acidobacteriota bacterium]
MKKIVLSTALALFGIFILAAAAAAQQTPKPAATPAASAEPGPIKSSPAYAEVLLRKTELEADLFSFADDYTDQNPRVIDARFELATLSKDIDRLFAVRPDDVPKLTLALGKLIVRRAEIETELNRLLRTYNADHPQVKRARKKAELFRDALKEILGNTDAPARR